MFGTWLKKSVGIMLGKGKSKRCIYSKNIGLNSISLTAAVTPLNPRGKKPCYQQSSYHKLFSIIKIIENKSAINIECAMAIVLQHLVTKQS